MADRHAGDADNEFTDPFLKQCHEQMQRRYKDAVDTVAHGGYINVDEVHEIMRYYTEVANDPGKSKCMSSIGKLITKRQFALRHYDALTPEGKRKAYDMLAQQRILISGIVHVDKLWPAESLGVRSQMQTILYGQRPVYRLVSTINNSAVFAHESQYWGQRPLLTLWTDNLGTMVFTGDTSQANINCAKLYTKSTSSSGNIVFSSALKSVKAVLYTANKTNNTIVFKVAQRFIAPADAPAEQARKRNIEVGGVNEAKRQRTTSEARATTSSPAEMEAARALTNLSAGQSRSQRPRHVRRSTLYGSGNRVTL